MMAPWEMASTGPAADLADRLAALLPQIETVRLILRAPRITDYPTFAAIYLSDRWMHDSPVDDEGAWLDFCQLVAGWLLRGSGIHTITLRSDASTLGFALLNHEYGDAELELGWMLTAEAEGQGYATEAAIALRDFAFDKMGCTTLVSYIAPGNDRSVHVAQRLGAQREPDERGALVYRHTQNGGVA